MGIQCVENCPFLELFSTPSPYLGEGQLVHYCKLSKEKVQLQHYLYHPLRTDDCIERPVLELLQRDIKEDVFVTNEDIKESKPPSLTDEWEHSVDGDNNGN